MKTIKRSIAFMLALVLTFAMSVTAFADEAKTYSITIDSAYTWSHLRGLPDIYW